MPHNTNQTQEREINYKEAIPTLYEDNTYEVTNVNSNASSPNLKLLVNYSPPEKKHMEISEHI